MKESYEIIQLLIEHLKIDLGGLQKALKMDELSCAILVHAVLKNIHTADHQKICKLYALSLSSLSYDTISL